MAWRNEKQGKDVVMCLKWKLSGATTILVSLVYNSWNLGVN